MIEKKLQKKLRDITQEEQETLRQCLRKVSENLEAV